MARIPRPPNEAPREPPPDVKPPPPPPMPPPQRPLAPPLQAPRGRSNSQSKRGWPEVAMIHRRRSRLMFHKLEKAKKRLQNICPIGQC